MDASRRRWWVRLEAVAAIAIVLVATADAVLRLAISAVPAYRQDLEARVARQLHVPVAIGDLHLSWQAGAPALALTDVAVLDTAGHRRLHITRVTMGIGWSRLLRGDWRFDRLAVDGLRIRVERDAQGHLRFPDLPLPAVPRPQVLRELLASFNSLQLRHCRVLYRDPRLGDRNFDVLVAELRLRHHGARYLLDGDLAPPATMARALRVRAELTGDPLQPASLTGDWHLDLDRPRDLPWLDRWIGEDVAIGFAGARVGADGAVAGGRVTSARVVASLQAISARRAGHGIADLRQVHIAAQYAASASGWRVQLDGLTLDGAHGAWPQAHGALQWTARADGGADVAADLNFARLDDITPWLALWQPPPRWSVLLPQPRGDLHGVTLRATVGGVPDRLLRWSAQARLASVGWDATGRLPAVADLSGQLQASDAGGRFQFSGSPPTLALPALLAQPLHAEALSGRLRWSRDDSGWTLEGEDISARLLAAQADGAFQLRWPRDAGEPPQLRLQLRFAAADVSRLQPLVPITWSAALRDWLQRAIRGGRVVEGSARFDGPLRAPTDATGQDTRWAADLKLDDARVDYAPGWPALQNLDAELHFADGGLLIYAADGRLGGLRVQAVRAQIPDFDAARLLLDARIGGDAARFYRVLRTSPLHRRLAPLLDHTRASGSAQVQLHLATPLAQAIEVSASGAVMLDGVRLAVDGVTQPFTQLVGTLTFGGDGLAAEGATARWYGLPLAVAVEPPRDPAVSDGVLAVDFDAAPGAADGPAGDYLPDWLRPRLSGQAHWQARLPLGGPSAGRLELSSDLRGVTSSLPAPLDKTAAQRLPVTIDVGDDGGLPRVAIEAAPAHADPLAVALRFAGDAAAPTVAGVAVRLGAGDPPDTAADGIVVTGHPRRLDLRSVAAVLHLLPAGAGGLPFVGAEIDAGRVRWGRLSVRDTRLRVTPNPADASLRVSLSGDAAGELWWQPVQDRLSADLTRLRLQPLSDEVLGAAARRAPASPLQPTDAPTLDLACRRLSIGDVDLGSLRLITGRIADGQRLQTLQVSGGAVNLTATGTWTRAHGNSAASAEFSMTVRRIGDLLQAFGFAKNLTAEEARFEGMLTWPHASDGLDLALAQGQIQLDVKRGTLLAVNPGAGRVLGLFNLYALPRRLTLNFHDVVGRGLAFDRIRGDFDLGAGQAITRDLTITGPSLRMDVAGRIGLAARDYDQTVTVYPDVSSGVTLGAALLGGPLAGGIALLAQQLVGKALDSIASLTYHVTGSWDNPKVERLGEQPAAASTAAAGAAAVPAPSHSAAKPPQSMP